MHKITTFELSKRFTFVSYVFIILISLLFIIDNILSLNTFQRINIYYVAFFIVTILFFSMNILCLGFNRITIENKILSVYIILLGVDIILVTPYLFIHYGFSIAIREAIITIIILAFLFYRKIMISILTRRILDTVLLDNWKGD